MLHLAAPSLASADLANRGFAVAPQPVISSTQAELLATACRDRLESLLAVIEAMGYDATEQSYQFSEVCHRQRLRWDMRPSFDNDVNEAWDAMCAAALTTATPIIRGAVGDDLLEPQIVMSGAVLSRPRCGAQAFHADGSDAHYAAADANPCHRLFTCFVPLVDIAHDGDGTQFWVGSHQGAGHAAARRGLAPDGTLRAAATATAPLEAPACRAGGMLMFDYRVMHRGLGSVGRERPVAYVVCGIGGAFDGDNFPQMSLEDASPLYVDHTPTWDEQDE